MKILVVEDDRKVAGFIEQGLREEGYVVDVAPDGDQGTMLAHVYDYDLLVLDVMLPKKTGLQMAAELRREGRATPISQPRRAMRVSPTHVSPLRKRPSAIPCSRRTRCSIVSPGKTEPFMRNFMRPSRPSGPDQSVR